MVLLSDLTDLKFLDLSDLTLTAPVADGTGDSRNVDDDTDTGAIEVCVSVGFIDDPKEWEATDGCGVDTHVERLVTDIASS